MPEGEAVGDDLNASVQKRLIHGIFRKGRQCLYMSTLQQHRSNSMPTPMRNLPCTSARQKATRTRKRNVGLRPFPLARHGQPQAGLNMTNVLARSAASSAWARRWWTMLAVSVQHAVTSTALGSAWPAPLHASQQSAPELERVLDLADAAGPSRLPLRGL